MIVDGAWEEEDGGQVTSSTVRTLQHFNLLTTHHYKHNELWKIRFAFSCSQHRGIFPPEGPIPTHFDPISLQPHSTSPHHLSSPLSSAWKTAIKSRNSSNRERSSVGEPIDKTPIMRLAHQVRGVGLRESKRKLFCFVVYIKIKRQGKQKGKGMTQGIGQIYAKEERVQVQRLRREERIPGDHLESDRNTEWKKGTPGIPEGNWCGDET